MQASRCQTGSCWPGTPECPFSQGNMVATEGESAGARLRPSFYATDHRVDGRSNGKKMHDGAGARNEACASTK
eukprot:4412204-Alexandrium_andersonii.AAC.1